MLAKNSIIIFYPTKTEPPLTFNTSPFMCLDKSEARKITGPAISSAVAILPIGIFSILRQDFFI